MLLEPLPNYDSFNDKIDRISKSLNASYISYLYVSLNIFFLEIKKC